MVFGEFVVWWLVCRVNRRQIEVGLSPDVIRCGWLGSKYQLTNCKNLLMHVVGMIEKYFIIICLSVADSEEDESEEEEPAKPQGKSECVRRWTRNASARGLRLGWQRFWPGVLYLNIPDLKTAMSTCAGHIGQLIRDVHSGLVWRWQVFSTCMQQISLVALFPDSFSDVG